MKKPRKRSNPKSPQSVSEKHKWRLFFKDHGCLKCERTDIPYASLGMCENCLSLMRERLQASIRRGKESNPPAPRSLVDAVDKNWEIIEQLSMWKAKDSGPVDSFTFYSVAGSLSVRQGFFRLRKKGSSKTLMVEYRALYELGVPYFFEDL